jgi:hypothetical protein
MATEEERLDRHSEMIHEMRREQALLTAMLANHDKLLVDERLNVRLVALETKGRYTIGLVGLLIAAAAAYGAFI